MRLISGIGIVFTVAGWALFDVTLLAFVGLLSVGLGWAGSPAPVHRRCRVTWRNPWEC
jgi:hypothetical protein